MMCLRKAVYESFVAISVFISYTNNKVLDMDISLFVWR